MKKISRILIEIMALVGLLIPMAPIVVHAQEAEIDKNLQCGANLQFNVPPEGCETDSNGNNAAERVDEIVTQIINIMSLAVGVVAVVMIIIGGLRYITSGGESGSVTGAKNTILYAVVGLIVVAMAQVIVKFVVNRATLSSGTSSSD